MTLADIALLLVILVCAVIAARWLLALCVALMICIREWREARRVDREIDKWQSP